MAIQSTMGPTNTIHSSSINDMYVKKNVFYWAVGIIILLIAAISFSMARDLSWVSLSNRTSQTDTTVNSATGTSMMNENMNNVRGQTYETVNPDTAGSTTGSAAGARTTATDYNGSGANINNNGVTSGTNRFDGSSNSLPERSE